MKVKVGVMMRVEWVCYHLAVDPYWTSDGQPSRQCRCGGGGVRRGRRDAGQTHRGGGDDDAGAVADGDVVHCDVGDGQRVRKP